MLDVGSPNVRHSTRSNAFRSLSQLLHRCDNYKINLSLFLNFLRLLICIIHVKIQASCTKKFTYTRKWSRKIKNNRP